MLKETVLLNDNNYYEALPDAFNRDKTKVYVKGEVYDINSYESLTPIEKNIIKKDIIGNVYANIIELNVDQPWMDRMEYVEKATKSFSNAMSQLDIMLKDNWNIDVISAKEIKRREWWYLDTGNNGLARLVFRMKNIHITPRGIGRMPLNDVIIGITGGREYIDFSFQEEVTEFGRKVFRPYVHPHISSEGKPCAGGFREDFKEALFSGNLLLLWSTLRSFLIKYNGRSPYWDPVKLLNYEFVYADHSEEEPETIGRLVLKGTDRMHFDRMLWANGLFSRDAAEYFSRKEIWAMFLLIKSKCESLGWGYYEICSLTKATLVAFITEMKDPRHKFSDDMSYRQSLTKPMRALFDIEQDIRTIRDSAAAQIRGILYGDTRDNVVVDKTILLQDSNGEYSDFFSVKWKHSLLDINPVHYFEHPSMKVSQIKYVNDLFKYFKLKIKESTNKKIPYFSPDKGDVHIGSAAQYIVVKKSAYTLKKKELKNLYLKTISLSNDLDKDVYYMKMKTIHNSVERIKKDAIETKLYSVSEMLAIDKSIAES